MKLVKCVDCHWLCGRLKRSRQPFETATTQLRERLKQRPDPWDSYSLKRDYDFSCHEHRESLNDYQASDIFDKIVKERECVGFSEFDPRHNLDQMKRIEVQSEAITIHEKQWWKNPGFLIMLLLAIISIILAIVLKR